MNCPSGLLLVSSFFEFSNIFLILGIVCLLFFSAFFSACEMALSTANFIRIKNLAEANKKGARKALYIHDHFDKALSTVLVGSNFVNVLSTTLCAYLLVQFIYNPVVYNLLNTIVMTIIILVFCEILPKSFAKNNAVKATLFLAPILYVVMKVTYVFCIPFNLLQKAFNRKKVVKPPTVTEDELETIVETMEDEGVIDEENADMIFGALKVSDVAVKDIMTPRVDVVCINVSSKSDEIKKIFLKHQFSRIPVYKRSKDNIIGILNQKDFFFAMLGKEEFNLEKMITPPLFVSKNSKVNNVMRLMQREKKHIAIVSDEYGGTSGVVTMEDCFEEVFGEVYDEHDDKEDELISEIAENKYLVNAGISVEELFDFLQIEKMPKNKYSSLSAFLCDLSKKIPQQNAEINYTAVDEVLNQDSNFIEKTINMKFKLVRVENRRIREVELTIK